MKLIKICLNWKVSRVQICIPFLSQGNHFLNQRVPLPVQSYGMTDRTKSENLWKKRCFSCRNFYEFIHSRNINNSNFFLKIFYPTLFPITINIIFCGYMCCNSWPYLLMIFAISIIVLPVGSCLSVKKQNSFAMLKLRNILTK